MARIQARRRRIGPLDCIEVMQKEGAPTVVLFHGFGADAADLAALAEVVSVPKDTNWIFPNGHLSVPLGGHFEGRAWFPIGVREMEAVAQTGVPLDFTQMSPPGLKRARQNAFDLLENLKLPLDKVILGGFSQGAMLAIDVTLESEQNPAGLAILSGTLVDSARWQQLAFRHKGLSFFQAHGAYDPVLPFEAAQKLEKVLRDGGLQGQLYRFDGAHAIPPEVLIRLGEYIRTRFK